ncbi:VOC family protein [Paenibacillus arenilitoris]|uniref:Glyoxalase/bleomycin resistance/extradiol dioxygenase family protein n=1 Tax=Paenibacillus arenilitoris TaxID=2772299 RepID=A0A927H6D4_9BACL|nr:glyoxalase/bleomycin resistance/extradiol dioxygenase family protein [Paenibacillus arenilitoris]MBD2869870.1 glyoxalase/bleomycin resistance/extradiol dioxygenase family protein [Paenibacillus arenilitoris]
MSVDVYLNFNGNCREAVQYYAQVFGTEQPKIMTFGDNPPDPNFVLPEEAKPLVMHARLSISGSNVMFSDVFPVMPFVEGNNVSLAIVDTNLENIKSWFNKLSDGGTIGMELQETFWSKCYGMLTDKFGINWQFNYDNGETVYS